MFTIARAEALLHSRVLPHNDPLELRAIYIEKLLQQFHSQIAGSRFVDQLHQHVFTSLQKRPFPLSNEDSTIPVAKKPRRPLFLEVSVATDEDRCRNLETLGSDWARFYSTQADSTGLSPDEVYQILALASAIASPQVLLDVADLCRSMSDRPSEMKQEMKQEMNRIAKAYWLYNHAEASIVSNQARQRGLALFLYQQFKALREHYQHLLKENRKNRRLKGYKPSLPTLSSGKPKDSTSYALDDLVGDCHNAKDMELNAKYYEEERNKIKKLKDQGEALFNFNERFRKGYGSIRVWRLLPMRRIRSAFDGNVYVSFKQ